MPGISCDSMVALNSLGVKKHEYHECTLVEEENEQGWYLGESIKFVQNEQA